MIIVKFLPSDVNLYSPSEISVACAMVYWEIPSPKTNLNIISTTPDFDSNFNLSLYRLTMKTIIGNKVLNEK